MHDFSVQHRWSGRWLACLMLGLAALMGCAGAPKTASPTGDLITASDETEGRRRARIRMELAVGYFEQGQTTVALDEIKQVLVLDPDFPDAYSLRGLVYMRLNDQRLAEDSFRRALALNPRDANALHNYGWMLCEQKRFPESSQVFTRALDDPLYTGKAKTLMAKGLCEARSGQRIEAENTLIRSYELDAGNPITGYNLALLLYQRREFTRAQFYVRRLNNSELANAESLWLGVRIERRLGNAVGSEQLAGQLKRRFPQSPEIGAFERGAFDE